MIANYGFRDGSGDWYVAIDSDKCNGCGKCVDACPAKALEVGPDEIDIFREVPVAFVRHDERKKTRYTCASCKPGYGEKPAPCVSRARQRQSPTRMVGNAFTDKANDRFL